MTRKTFIIISVLVLLLAGCATVAAPQETPSLDTAGEPDVSTQPPAKGIEAQPEKTMNPDMPISSEDDTIAGGGIRSPQDALENEDQMLRGSVMLDTSELLILESYPIQVRLALRGNLPTPCHKLRAVVSEPDSEKRINVEVYSLSEPEEVCIQVIQPFETVLDLGTYTSGVYTVVMNGDVVGEFDAG